MNFLLNIIKFLTLPFVLAVIGTVFVISVIVEIINLPSNENNDGDQK